MTKVQKIVNSILTVMTGAFVLSVMPGIAIAATNNSGPITVAADISANLELVVSIRNGLTNTIVPSMTFGELSQDSGDYRAKTFFVVSLKAGSGGSAYEISQTGTSLVRAGGSETIPDGAFIVTPAYDPALNNGQSLAPGSSVSALSSAVGTHVLFQDQQGRNATVSASYTLSGAPDTGATAVIPLSQKSGTYASTIQYTLTTV